MDYRLRGIVLIVFIAVMMSLFLLAQAHFKNALFLAPSNSSINSSINSSTITNFSTNSTTSTSVNSTNSTTTIVINSTTTTSINSPTVATTALTVSNQTINQTTTINSSIIA